MARSRGGARVDAWDHTTILTGRWDTKGAATPTVNVKGKGATVTRTAQGIYTIVLDSVIREVLSYDAKLHMGTPNGSYAVMTISLASNGILTATVTTYDHANAAADIAAAAGNVVTWTIRAKRVGTR